MHTSDAIKYLDEQVADAKNGLPEDVFLFISRMTPMVNVDLLIKDENNRVLLSWRDDQYAGKGWHIPGGIVRFKEKLEERLTKISQGEIGTIVEFNPIPLAFNEFFCTQKTRGHFLSILYQCSLSRDFVPENKGLTDSSPGFLKWHNKCPKNLVSIQETYRKYIDT